MMDKQGFIRSSSDYGWLSSDYCDDVFDLLKDGKFHVGHDEYNARDAGQMMRGAFLSIRNLIIINSWNQYKSKYPSIASSFTDINEKMYGFSYVFMNAIAYPALELVGVYGAVSKQHSAEKEYIDYEIWSTIWDMGDKIELPYLDGDPDHEYQERFMKSSDGRLFVEALATTLSNEIAASVEHWVYTHIGDQE